MDAATSRAENLRLLLRHAAFEFREMKLPQATFSVGVAAYPVQGKTGADLLSAVDAALYRAKQAGGARVAR